MYLDRAHALLVFSRRIDRNAPRQSAGKGRYNHPASAVSGRRAQGECRAMDAGTFAHQGGAKLSGLEQAC